MCFSTTMAGPPAFQTLIISSMPRSPGPSDRLRTRRQTSFTRRSSIRRAGGALYLARTNLIFVHGVPGSGTVAGNPSIYLGHNTQGQNQNPAGAAMYLGITNAIFGDYIVVGRGNQTNNLMAFNPA